MKVEGDTTICMYTINWIVVGDAIDFAEIKLNCTLCPQLNTGFGFRSQNFSGRTKFIGYTSLDVRVYISGFWMKNAIGLVNYLLLDASIPKNTNIINYVFQTN
jgi:hypothetical protein